jgi:hypothetical protein
LIAAEVVMVSAMLIAGYVCGGALHASSAVAPAADGRCTRERAEPIIAEVAMFYRDLQAKRWPALVDHFWPAKIAAHQEAPVADSAWRDCPLLANGAKDPGCCTYAIDGVPGAPAWAEIHVVAQWARVLVSRPTASDATESCLDELWLYSLSGRWKILHLASAAHREVSSRAQPKRGACAQAGNGDDRTPARAAAR